MSILKATVLPENLLDCPFIPPEYIRGHGAGFLFAGSVIVDTCFATSQPPAVDSLVYTIGPKVRSVGGLVPNDAIAMKMLDRSIDVLPVGMIGADASRVTDPDGKFIQETLAGYDIVTNGLVSSVGEETSFTTIPTSSGKKMFIHGYGACESFCAETFPNLNSGGRRIVFVGYLNLLPSLMKGGGVGARELIEKLRRQYGYCGIDFTDIYDEGFPKLFQASVGVADFMITNEMSIAKGTGIEIYPDGKLDCERLLQAAEQTIEMGKNLQWIAIHWPTGGMFYNRDHQVVTYPVHQLKPGDYVGTTGAGDNWAVGFLAAAFKGRGPLFALCLATTAAAKSLGSLSATGASGSFDELRRFDSQRSLLDLPEILETFYPSREDIVWRA